MAKQDLERRAGRIAVKEGQAAVICRGKTREEEREAEVSSRASAEDATSVLGPSGLDTDLCEPRMRCPERR